jgi:hypothetical protein
MDGTVQIKVIRAQDFCLVILLDGGCGGGTTAGQSGHLLLNGGQLDRDLGRHFVAGSLNVEGNV